MIKGTRGIQVLVNVSVIHGANQDNIINNNKDNITNNNTYLILFTVFLIGFIVFLIGYIYYYCRNNSNKRN